MRCDEVQAFSQPRYRSDMTFWEPTFDTRSHPNNAKRISRRVMGPRPLAGEAISVVPSTVRATTTPPPGCDDAIFCHGRPNAVHARHFPIPATRFSKSRQQGSAFVFVHCYTTHSAKARNSLPNPVALNGSLSGLPGSSQQPRRNSKPEGPAITHYPIRCSRVIYEPLVLPFSFSIFALALLPMTFVHFLRQSTAKRPCA